MALKSMTGYGRGEASSAAMTVEVELSSVNRKQFECRVNLPRSLSVLNSRITKLLRNALSRGVVTGSVKISLSGQSKSSAVSVDEATASAYVSALRKTAASLNIKDDLTTSNLINLPDVLQYKDAATDTDKVWLLLKRALNAAISALIEMRESEGKALQRDLEKRFVRLRTVVKQIRKIAPSIPTRHAKAMKERLKQADLQINIKDEDLIKEIAIFADKSDITEELTRLDSHLEQVADLISGKMSPGRSLDFLCQEFLREINTVGSKANDERLTRKVILFKSELESIREQVQNVE